MYLWVVIATFITALFALNFSYRSDIKELYVEPRAETVATKLYAQHRAAMQYISVRNRNSEKIEDSYSPGELKEDMLEADLPYGFNVEKGFSKFTTWVYCLDKDKLENSGAAALPASCSGTIPPGGANPDLGVGNCCSGPGVAVYILTYGCAPARWRDLRTGRPSAELLETMNTTSGYVHGMGYVIGKEEYESAGKPIGSLKTDQGVYVHGFNRYEPIPNYIINTSTGDKSFANVCGSQRGADTGTAGGISGSCNHCLVYMTGY